MVDDALVPCRTCGSDDVVLIDVDAPGRPGDVGPNQDAVRRCRNPECPTNTGTGRTGDTV